MEGMETVPSPVRITQSVSGAPEAVATGARFRFQPHPHRRPAPCTISIWLCTVELLSLYLEAPACNRTRVMTQSGEQSSSGLKDISDVFFAVKM